MFFTTVYLLKCWSLCCLCLKNVHLKREAKGNHFCLLYSIDFRFTYPFNPPCFGLFCNDKDNIGWGPSSPPLHLHPYPSNVPGNVSIKLNHYLKLVEPQSSLNIGTGLLNFRSRVFRGLTQEIGRSVSVKLAFILTLHLMSRMFQSVSVKLALILMLHLMSRMFRSSKAET